MRRDGFEIGFWITWIVGALVSLGIGGVIVWAVIHIVLRFAP